MNSLRVSWGIWWICLALFLVLLVRSAQAGESCWQDSAQYKHIIAMDDSPVHRVDAAVLFLEWREAEKSCVALVYCNGNSQAPHAVAVVSMKDGYQAIEPRQPLFAYADTPQGAIEELWGGEKMKVKYFTWR